MELETFLRDWNSGSPTLLVHTSGSTGKPKPMMVEKKRMVASATATCDFLGLKRGDTALLCMPLDYIAGKMVVVRSIVRHMKLISVKPSSRPFASLTESPDFAAVTPMQVYETMKDERELGLMRGVRQLIIGGGAISADMGARLRAFPNAVWSTYGMTETLSHVAMRRLSGAGASEWYTPLKGVTVSADGHGCLVIDAPAVCSERLTTNDIAEFEGNGTNARFKIIGRVDNNICSGGIKIQAEEVERLLDEEIRRPFVVTWTPDDKLGQAVTLVIETGGEAVDMEDVERLCRNVLPKYWVPRIYRSVDHIPRTETGKLKRRF